jgi:hypothetical protein
MKAIITVIFVTSLLFLADGCQTAFHLDLPDVITVKTPSGDPVTGATVLSEEEVLASLPYYVTPQEIKKRTTDNSGQAKIDLRRHLWHDGTFHFLVTKAGYREVFLQEKKTEYRGEIVVDLKLGDKSTPRTDEQVERPSGKTSSGNVEPGTVRTRSFDSSGNLIDEKQSSQSAQPQPSGK